MRKSELLCLLGELSKKDAEINRLNKELKDYISKSYVTREDVKQFQLSIRDLNDQLDAYKEANENLKAQIIIQHEQK